ncbi:MAG TPA: bifunctional diguanylate cyclase/phosphodiesterase [Methylophilaceae bacterium]|jgi:diguanylate cyclase (GGDEF)-like protein
MKCLNEDYVDGNSEVLSLTDQLRLLQLETETISKLPTLTSENLTIQTQAYAGDIKKIAYNINLILERLIDKKSEKEKQIYDLAFHDPLTGLQNRRFIMQKLEAITTAEVDNQEFNALIYIDIDKFKALNDTKGHEYGDMLLIEVARRMKNLVRVVDIVSRFGGDEFVILVQKISEYEEDASAITWEITERIRDTLAAPYELNNYVHHSSPSIGICLFNSNHQSSAGEIIKCADIAMYQAKQAGGNRRQFFDPEMQKTIEDKVAIQNDLKDAIQSKQLSLHYQLQVDENSQPIGAEALIRWQHPVKGNISPVKFIAIAETTDLIIDIGNWVLETALRQLKTWERDSIKNQLTLAVNISAKQFNHPDFIEYISKLISKHKVNSKLLKFELTEGVAVSDIDSVIEKMNVLKDMFGIRISLDDFGTGFSSLSYLKKLPIEQVKIDRSFVRDMTVDQNDASMVKAIVDMAKTFNLEVIAEGVETEEQHEMLAAYGCNFYQGYLFSKPLAIEKFDALLDSFSVVNELS